MKNNRFLISVVVAVVIMSGALLVFNGCEKEEEIPWYEDGENWEVILEDERSDEKNITTYGRYSAEDIYFNYQYDESDRREYIPKARIYYKYVEQSVYTFVYKREGFDRYPDGPDYDHPYLENAITSWGNYRVTLYFYLSKEEFEKPLSDRIGNKVIYINVYRGEEI